MKRKYEKGDSIDDGFMLRPFDSEFAPYRALGWSSTEQNNADADAYLEALGRQELSA